MPPAARVTDNHLCPKLNADPASSPHVGGPILGKPGKPKVLIGKMPAATEGCKCFCVSPETDKISKGSSSVFIDGKAAARMGDLTEHGGSIVSGCPTVLIGG